MEKRKKVAMNDFLLRYGILIFIVGALTCFNYLNDNENGWTQVKEGFKNGWDQLISFTLLLAFIFVGMGQAEIAIAKNKEKIKAWISGDKGLVTSCIAGLISPGSLGGLPTAKKMWEDPEHDNDKAAILAFIVSLMLCNIQTKAMQATAMGWRLTIISCSINFLMLVLFILAIWIHRKIFV